MRGSHSNLLVTSYLRDSIGQARASEISLSLWTFCGKLRYNSCVKRAKKHKDWKPSFHEGSHKWRVAVPKKLSLAGKRYDKYFDSQKSAETFIADTLKDRAEHGKRAVSSEDRHWINVARTELGDLSLLPKVLAHWKKTGDEAIRARLVLDAVHAFKTTQKKRVSARTFSDISWRLDKFTEHFGGRSIHQIHSGEIEQWLDQYPVGWSRKSMFKRLGPLFAYAIAIRLLAVNPLALLSPPETPSKRRAVYTPSQFVSMLKWAQSNSFHVVLPFLGLSGLCFLRTSELVRLYSNENVLCWEDILWDRKKINIRAEVAKSTKRANNERFPPFGQAFENVMIGQKRDRKGPVITMLHHEFSKDWRRMHDALEIKPIPNGMRRSAISYTLAARPELGIVQASKWAGNSEATIKSHYLEILTQEEGEAWFNLPVLF